VAVLAFSVAGLANVQACFRSDGKQRLPTSAAARLGRRKQHDLITTSRTSSADQGPQEHARQGLLRRHDHGGCEPGTAYVFGAIGHWASFHDQLHASPQTSEPTFGCDESRRRRWARQRQPDELRDSCAGTQPTIRSLGRRRRRSVNARVPLEFYYPYVEDSASPRTTPRSTQAPSSTRKARGPTACRRDAHPFGNGLRKSDAVLSRFGFDRPTWIRWLKPACDLALHHAGGHQLDHDTSRSKYGPSPPNFLATTGQTIALDGDVGVPNSTLIPGRLRPRSTCGCG